MLPQNRWLVLAIVSSALFLIVVDMTVLYTALPRLTHDLAASASEKLWIMNIYPLVVAGLLPGLGTLGDKLGHKRMFMNGLAVFGLASLCAAYSPNPEILIAARAFLACGAAMMILPPFRSSASRSPMRKNARLPSAYGRQSLRVALPSVRSRAAFCWNISGGVRSF